MLMHFPTNSLAVNRSPMRATEGILHACCRGGGPWGVVHLLQRSYLRADLARGLVALARLVAGVAEGGPPIPATAEGQRRRAEL